MKQLYFSTFDHFISQKPFFPYKGLLTRNSMLQIRNIINQFDKKYLLNLKKEMVVNLLKYNVDGNWGYRLAESDKYKKDGFSIESCKVRYGDIIGEKIHKERIEKVKSKKENYTESKWKIICQKKKSNLGLNGYIKKYGKVNGRNRWNSYLEKWKIGIEKKKIEGWKSGCTLENLQEIYGIREGYNIWKNRIIKHKHSFSLYGYLEKYGEKKGEELWEKTCKNRNTMSLESFIRRYGGVIGKKRYDESVKRSSHSMSIEGFVERYGDYLGHEKYNEWLIKVTSYKFNGYSKISQELFWSIYEKLDVGLKQKCYFNDLNTEIHFFVNKKWAKMIYVDFKCGNVMIEFDGDYWHTLKYHVYRDEKRDIFLTNKGYKILRIKEKEYNLNKQIVVNTCLQFIKENYERPHPKS